MPALFKDMAQGWQYTPGFRYEWNLPVIEEGVAISRREADMIAAGMKKQEAIKLLVVGFDNTLVQVHTAMYRNDLDGKVYSAWGGSAEQLAGYVRPLLHSVVCGAHRAGIKVAISTHCDQIALLQDMVQLVFPKQHQDIFITAAADTISKLAHIEGCLEHFKKHCPEECGDMSLSNVLFIDDNSENADEAEEAGCKVAWLPTSVPYVCLSTGKFDGNVIHWGESILYAVSINGHGWHAHAPSPSLHSCLQL
jgi:hypothetical protein